MVKRKLRSYGSYKRKRLVEEVEYDTENLAEVLEDWLNDGYVVSMYVFDEEVNDWQLITRDCGRFIVVVRAMDELKVVYSVKWWNIGDIFEKRITLDSSYFDENELNEETAELGEWVIEEFSEVLDNAIDDEVYFELNKRK